MASRRRIVGLLAACVALLPGRVDAYGVLTHIALVDAAWDSSLVPALKRRFPGLTENELPAAHACAWGGALVQDIGYYPGGSREMGDLLHYVRSGDFVRALVDESQDACDYAFALGAAAHWLGDAEGHARGVNPAVAMTFPKLRREYGDAVTYAQDHKAHLRVEFGFDVVQVARGLYPSEAYRERVGFAVPVPVLDRALRRTYGLGLADFTTHPDRMVRSARHFVASLFPKATRVAWAYKKDEIRRLLPQVSDRAFVLTLSNPAFEKRWGRDYDKPGLGSRVGAFLLKLVPKVGPLRVLIPKPPSPEAEARLAASFTEVLREYRARVAARDLDLADVNLDVGKPTAAGTYEPSDRAWSRLVARLSTRAPDPALREAIVAHYGGRPPR